MRKWSQIAVTSVVALALASPVFAQSSSTSPTTGADSSTSSGTTQGGQTSTQTGQTSTQSGQTSTSDSTSTSTSTTAATGGGGAIAEQQTGQTLSSDLVGMKVMGAGEESIGEVSDLLMEDGKVVGAVMNVGGFLGLGAKKVAVPWDQLSVSEAEGSMVATVDLSKEQLTSMPEFKTKTEAMAEDSRTSGTATQ